MRAGCGCRLVPIRVTRHGAAGVRGLLTLRAHRRRQAGLPGDGGTLGTGPAGGGGAGTDDERLVVVCARCVHELTPASTWRGRYPPGHVVAAGGAGARGKREHRRALGARGPANCLTHRPSAPMTLVRGPGASFFLLPCGRDQFTSSRNDVGLVGTTTRRIVVPFTSQTNEDPEIGFDRWDLTSELPQRPRPGKWRDAQVHDLLRHFTRDELGRRNVVGHLVPPCPDGSVNKID